MRLLLVALISSATFVGFAPASVDACGIKLNARATNVARRSAHPSTVHLVGVENYESLRRALRRAGHQVVVVTDASEVARRDALVLTNPAAAGNLRESVPQGIVVVAGDNVPGTVAAIERRLASRAGDNS